MEKQTNKPTAGTWDKMTNATARNPKVQFELNKPEVCSFLGDPREGKSAGDPDSVYYTFDVVHNGLPTVIQTSAWTLLEKLAKYSPLEGKTLAITKKMEKAKQYFDVEEIAEVEAEQSPANTTQS